MLSLMIDLARPSDASTTAMSNAREPAKAIEALTDEAKSWMSLVSPSLRIDALVNHRPDIANQLAASWSCSSSTVRLLQKLLIDESVRALPPTLLNELLRLYEHVHCAADAQGGKA